MNQSLVLFQRLQQQKWPPNVAWTRAIEQLFRFGKKADTSYSFATTSPSPLGLQP
jgi:hypothetical protein